MTDIEDLQELGLTKNEAKVYHTLLMQGTLPASVLSAKSGVSYSRIYDILESLVHKTLVSVIPAPTKQYAPTSPQQLSELIEKRTTSLNQLRGSVKRLQKLYTERAADPVIVEFGDKGFHTLVKLLPVAKKYSYYVKWKADFKPEWVRIHDADVKRNVDLKTLTRYDVETKQNVDKWITVEKNYRQIENEGIALSIIDDKEVMIGLIKSDATLLIRDKPFAKLMKKLFLATYKEATPILKN